MRVRFESGSILIQKPVCHIFMSTLSPSKKSWRSCAGEGKIGQQTSTLGTSWGKLGPDGTSVWFTVATRTLTAFSSSRRTNWEARTLKPIAADSEGDTDEQASASKGLDAGTHP